MDGPASPSRTGTVLRAPSMSSEYCQSSDASLSNMDNCSVFTPAATSEHTLADPTQGQRSGTWVPSHGSTVIIRAVSSENVLTLLDGSVVLAPIGSRGSIHWSCVEREGWLGFRNCSSNKFICHGWDGRLKCTAEERDGWRHLTLTPVPKGGYIMQMLDWWVLRPIVLSPEKGLQKLARTGNKLSDGVVWEFINAE